MPSTSGTDVRVYLLDDHDIVRQGLRDLLVPARDIRVVGDSGRATHAVEAILRLETDVMVLDLHLQDGSGVHVCRHVRAADPSVRGLLLTSSDDDEALAAAVLAGASGYVVKLARSSDVLGAIRGVGAGRELMDASLAQHAAGILRERAAAIAPALTDAQWELLDHLLEARTDAQIAQETDRDLMTVRDEVIALVDRLLGVAGHGKHRRPPSG
jgi:DNA-binding NarL/FixJ family response regulator